MPNMCSNDGNDNNDASRITATRAARRRRVLLRRESENNKRRQRMEKMVQIEKEKKEKKAVVPSTKGRAKKKGIMIDLNKNTINDYDIFLSLDRPYFSSVFIDPSLMMYLNNPKFGATAVVGRRRDMEDIVAVYPRFCRRGESSPTTLHFYGVFDGHGCSHVAEKCGERMHAIVREEINKSVKWQQAMERSFKRMDMEVTIYNRTFVGAKCRCVLKDSDAVGSTACVAVVTPEKIIVANCGDSRAVLCRNGRAIPLSSDQKPDRPDELKRIEEAGGRVVFWDGARVLGILAMSRAIGDDYLKPFVTCLPEVTITDRSPEDECLILATDGLWDVIPNESACEVAKMCIQGNPPSWPELDFIEDIRSFSTEKECADASVLLTKLALAKKTEDNVGVVVVDLTRDMSES